MEMISLAGVPYIPLHRGVAAVGDWTVVAALFVVMAIAFGAMYVIGNRSAKRRPTREHERIDSDRKAA